MPMYTAQPRADVVMLGTFSTWRLGTLQARALPIAEELTRQGVSVTVITTPWDAPEEAGVRDVVHGVPVINTRRVSQFATGPAVAEMVRLTRRLCPHVVHLFKPRGFGGFAASYLAGEFPLVVDCDDWEGDGGWNRIGGYRLPQRRLFDWQERSLVRRASAVTAASTLLETRARHIRSGLVQQNVVRVPNALPERRLMQFLEARSRVQDAPVTVLLYSRFEELGVEWLGCFATALLRNSAASGRVRIAVVGDLPESLCGLELPQELDLMGYVAHDKLPSVLSRAAIAVVPQRDSLVARSKQSVKLLELMASGCVVVASDVGDVGATLGSGGVCIRGHNPEVFAREVATLLHHPEMIEDYSAGAIGRVRSSFCAPSVLPAVRSAYAAAGARIAC